MLAKYNAIYYITVKPIQKVYNITFSRLTIDLVNGSCKHNMLYGTEDITNHPTIYSILDLKSSLGIYTSMKRII